MAGCTVEAKIDSRPAILDCHLPSVQSGVSVKRLSDDKIVRVDVCGAADSSDDTSRSEAQLLFSAFPAHALIPAMPDSTLTPGVARPLTKAQICTTKWGRDARHVTTATKKKVCLAYGISTGCPGKAWELDHLISRELAGADDAKNLWPQPIAEARKKDRLENALHRDVCAGKISLDEAQREISTDWWATYQKYFPEPKPAPAPNPLAGFVMQEAAR